MTGAADKARVGPVPDPNERRSAGWVGLVLRLPWTGTQALACAAATPPAT